MEEYIDDLPARLAQYDEWEKHYEKYGYSPSRIKQFVMPLQQVENIPTML